MLTHCLFVCLFVDTHVFMPDQNIPSLLLSRLHYLISFLYQSFFAVFHIPLFLSLLLGFSHFITPYFFSINISFLL